MKTTRFIGVLLVMALLWASGYLVADAGVEGKDETTAAVSVSPKTDSTAVLPHKVVAYYFHGNFRCARCRKFEAYTGEAIDSAFGGALKSGLLEWRVVNTDSAQNEHYVEDYQLYTKAVIVTDVHKGKQTRWKNLDRIWMLHGDKPEFVKYIQTEVAAFLDTTQ